MKLKFDARARAIMQRLPIPSVYSAAELVLLGLLAFQAARLVWVAVTPVAPVGEWRASVPTIPAAPGDVLRGFDPFYRLEGGGDAPAVVTSLRLTLFGTRVDEASGRGSAIIAGPDGIQKSVAVGEEIIPGVTLKEVAFDHVTIDRGGAREDLFLDQSAGTANAASPGVAPAPGAVPPPVAGNPPPGGGITISRFRAEVGFVPRIEGGKIAGLVVRSQGSGAAFRAAGLKEGDIITAVGGRSISNPADLDIIAGGLNGGGTLSLTVQRDGQSIPLSLAVAPQ
ncbi:MULTISPECIES: type II secretion system protein N [unclassified Sphingomonas]|uniref:type II secretion system protein N n=1 Tax=unclassified Sphingomonas TaxID=196159 RepID=UPI000929DD6C|nr:MULTISPECIES: type II secretion system protein N [unclassified Sphingomonas]OJU17492.1 MAG: type II secretory protein PulC [Sphingomonas sp. 66-10]